MKILIVSTYDWRGGAGKAAYRFAKQFKNDGHDVCLYVNYKKMKDTFVVESKRSYFVKKITHLLDFLPGYLLSGFDNDCGFTLGLFGENLNEIIEKFKPDVINIHWTWKGFVSFNNICKISKNIPVIWTMHDQSPFSGGLFYPNRKKRILLNLLVKVNSVMRKISIRNADITFVSPSMSLLKDYKKSYIGNHFKGLVINNGINKEIFRPRSKEKKELKLDFGLEADKKYILFGGMNLVNNDIKGGVILIEVFQKIETFLIENNIGVLSYGSEDPFQKINLNPKIKTKFFGYIDDDKVISSLISCSDVVLVPSFFENYPFVVIESLGCNVPVVAFSVGGIPEIITDERKGYLAKPFSPEDFAHGIMHIIQKDVSDYDKNFLDIENKSKEYLELFDINIKTSRS